MDDKKKKFVAQAISGAFDPLFRKGAQYLAQRVPKDSGVRDNVILESAGGVMKGLLEMFGDSLSPVLATAIEKGTDFHDFFMTALSSVPKEEREKAFKGLAHSFLESSKERLQKAADPQAEKEKIKAEFLCLKEIAQLVEQTEGDAEREQKTEEPKGPLLPPAITDALNDLMDVHMSWMEKRIRTLQARRKK